MRKMKNSRTAFTLAELAAIVVIILILIALLIPLAGRSTCGGGIVAVSMNNLRNFGAAHAMYASEWNGRQWTTTPDDVDSILNEGRG